MLFEPYVSFHMEIAAHSAYDMFSWYKFMFFPPLGFSNCTIP